MSLAWIVVVFWLGFAVAIIVTRKPMSLSDCPKCWDTPCTCGHEYKSWSIERIEEHIAMLQGVIAEKKEMEDAGSAQPRRTQGLGETR